MAFILSPGMFSTSWDRRDVSYLSEIQPEYIHMSSPPTIQYEKSS